MISRWRLRNFKSVREGDIGLHPLTIISGVNSSGKSAIAQSMAVVAQTVANQIEREPLLLNGYLMSLGTYRNVRAASEEHSPVGIGWDAEPLDVIEGETSDDEMVTVGSYATRESEGLRRISCDILFEEDPHEHATVRSGRVALEEEQGEEASIEWMLPGERSSSSASEGWLVQLDDKSAGVLRRKHAALGTECCQLRHFLPSRLEVTVLSGLREAEFRADYLCQHYRPLQAARHPLLSQPLPDAVRDIFIQHVDPKLPAPEQGASFATWVALLGAISADSSEMLEVIQALRHEVLAALQASTDGPAPTKREHMPLPRRLPEAIFYVETFFATQFRYLGPLRDEPRAVYPHPTKLDPIDLGRRGEYAAAVYHAHRNTRVRHISRDALNEFGPFGSEETATLTEAVNEWLQYLNIAHHLQSREEKHGHVFVVGTDENSGWEMLHVGTGVSQVVPILIMGLLAQVDDTLVIEHPELHLHPRAQSQLADFFLFLASTRRQAIVETHSEHILNRLRRRIAAPGGEVFREQLGIIFAETIGTETKFRDVTITEYGAIEFWPEGFFDEAIAESERIVRAALEKHGKHS